MFIYVHCTYMHTYVLIYTIILLNQIKCTCITKSTDGLVKTTSERKLIKTCVVDRHV